MKPSTVGKGGKAWIREEEFLFWKQLVPYSKKRVGDDIENNEEHEWPWVAEQMRKRMRERFLKEGEPDRRDYTGLAMFEHYWQSARHRRPTPAAGRFVNRYCNCEGDPEQVAKRDERLIAVREKRRQARRSSREKAREEAKKAAKKAGDNSGILPSIEDDSIEDDDVEDPGFDEDAAIRDMEDLSDSESSPEARPVRRRNAGNRRNRSASPKPEHNGTLGARRRARQQREEKERRDHNLELYKKLGAGGE
ncbi:hypothetical protein QBC40DRAFT_293476 [Triangularia verruculosa]|uniref:Uncharacterized protein n=1 Tax=Triangularia verruculosa TaxID=2587418 RepID=A0AAN7AYR6_9PEZI|nr:hypothetical protein QBC40DRAFT_293476 [Triangularia verruculosa]